MARSRGDRIDGVLLLDKPGGITSNLALQKARRLLAAAKAGHTGTLDPMATGLLPLAFGEATKFAADLIDADKAYRATLRLGVTTSTGDADGEELVRVVADVSPAQLRQVLERFVGATEQVPPMHSALKRNGRPLYSLARAGVAVERAARPVRIDRLELVELDGDRATIDLECSKGTYVRVLAEDIGGALGCGAHLAALRRVRVGALTVDDAVPLATLEAMAPRERRARLLPADALLTTLPRVELDAELAERFCHGQRLAIDAAPRGGRVRVYGGGRGLLGTANVNEWGVVGPERLISHEPDHR